MSHNKSQQNGTGAESTTGADSDSSTTRSEASLSGEGLVLTYPSSDGPIIDGESITAEPGAVTALVGPNGSGKSTLLKGLANQLTPEAGSVLLDGEDIQNLGTKAIARKLGLLPQVRTSPNSKAVEDLL
jgi:iron complex transport system ATP-binding protein